MKTSSLPDQFVSSLSFDIRLAPYDIKGSIAHAQMLGKTRILPQKDVEKIVHGLHSILQDIKKGKSIAQAEDFHLAVEKELIQRIGEAGQKLHTARSRNDQVITDLYLYLKDQIGILITDIKDLQAAFIGKAQQHRAVIMPGFTHLQHAQPVLFSHHILAYAWMLDRDRSRLEDLTKRVNVLPLGSAALAGTSFPINRMATAKLLGFKTVSENSIDATASRDVALEFLTSVAILMTHLSRLAEELIIWSSTEFSFVVLGEEFTTGSSIMPQKRNPDMAELIRGKTGRVLGDVVALFTIIKGTPLAYNRDLQEDKPPLFDASDTVHNSLAVLAPMIKSMKVNKEVMERASSLGFLAATELADYLTKKGIPFRAAHGFVQNIVNYCRAQEKKLHELTLKDLKRFHPLFEKDTLPLLKPENVVRNKTSYGGTSHQSVELQIKKLKARIRS